MEKQMKNRILFKLRKVMATTIMACMLLTVVGVSSDADLGVMLYGAKIDSDYSELE